MPASVLWIGLLVLTSCGPVVRPAVQDTSEDDLAGTAWTLQQIAFDDGTVRDGTAQLSFGTDGRMRVDSCNECSGTYSLERDALRIGPLDCTRRTCRGSLELEHYLEGPLTVEHGATGAGGGSLHLRFSTAGLGERSGRLVFTTAGN